MIKVKVPATSANLGPGFDILGLALTLYNEFIVDLSDKYIIDSPNAKFNNSRNLFCRAFDIVAKSINSNKKCYVKYNKINIPFSRGLGSSSALIVAGAISANYLLNANLPKSELLRLCTIIEGHPDNVAPCLYGGITISMMTTKNKKTFPITKKIQVKNNIKPTVIIPDYEVSTAKAREIIKKEIPLETSIFNTSHALLSIYAFQNGDLDLLSMACDDKIHVPYRKTLIKSYDFIKNKCIKSGCAAFTISGSGPTMIAFSDIDNFSKKLQLDKKLKCLDLKIDNKGAFVINN